MIRAKALLLVVASLAGSVWQPQLQDASGTRAANVAIRAGAGPWFDGRAAGGASAIQAGRGAAPSKPEESSAFERRLIAWGPLGVFFLALFDSAIPVPAGPEIALAIVSAKHASRGYLAAALAVIGSIAGNLVLFGLARKGGEAYLERKCVTPRTRRFRGWFLRYGLLTVFIPALLPVPPLPEKIFLLSAGALGVSTRAFVLTLVAARIPRYFGIAYVAVKAGRNWKVWFAQNGLPMALFAAVLFAVLYAAIAIKGRKRPHAPAA